MPNTLRARYTRASTRLAKAGMMKGEHVDCRIQILGIKINLDNRIDLCVCEKHNENAHVCPIILIRAIKTRRREIAERENILTFVVMTIIR